MAGIPSRDRYIYSCPDRNASGAQVWSAFEVYAPSVARIEHAIACSDLKPSSYGFLMLWHFPQSILNSTLISEPSVGL